MAATPFFSIQCLFYEGFAVVLFIILVIMVSYKM